jgi:lipid II:glycine glycyltransferase (peptidoglycan interpeptide bridge formation enzyme)
VSTPAAVCEATPAELLGWDTRTVDVPGGHVLQSRAWAAHRATTGWRAHHLLVPDGGAVLALVRPWPIGGGGAYLPRGPVTGGADAAAVAARLDTVAGWLGAHGVDVVASDAEVEADTGYPGMAAAAGFHPIEEIQPSRHRMRLPLGPGVDEAAALAGCQKSTRQRIRAAERSEVVVRRWDARISDDGPGEGFVAGGPDPRPALDRFFDLELATAARRGFSLGPRTAFLDWWTRAWGEGRLVYLEVVAAEDAARPPEAPVPPLAGLVLYRHGGRLSTVQSGDRADARRSHAGILHLVRWRAIQLAIREGCAEMDLGGADVAGARERPEPGSEMHGLYEHKRGFGAEWVQLAGAHERVIRPWRYAAGRVASRLRRGAA